MCVALVPDCPEKHLPTPRDLAAPGGRLHPTAQEEGLPTGLQEAKHWGWEAAVQPRRAWALRRRQFVSRVSQEIAIGFSISRRASGVFPHTAEARSDSIQLIDTNFPCNFDPSVLPRGRQTLHELGPKPGRSLSSRSQATSPGPHLRATELKSRCPPKGPYWPLVGLEESR